MINHLEWLTAWHGTGQEVLITRASNRWYCQGKDFIRSVAVRETDNDYFDGSTYAYKNGRMERRDDDTRKALPIYDLFEPFNAGVSLMRARAIVFEVQDGILARDERIRSRIDSFFDRMINDAQGSTASYRVLFDSTFSPYIFIHQLVGSFTGMITIKIDAIDPKSKPFGLEYRGFVPFKNGIYTGHAEYDGTIFEARDGWETKVSTDDPWYMTMMYNKNLEKVVNGVYIKRRCRVEPFANGLLALPDNKFRNVPDLFKNKRQSFTYTGLLDEFDSCGASVKFNKRMVPEMDPSLDFQYIVLDDNYIAIKQFCKDNDEVTYFVVKGYDMGGL